MTTTAYSLPLTLGPCDSAVINGERSTTWDILDADGEIVGEVESISTEIGFGYAQEYRCGGYDVMLDGEDAAGKTVIAHSASFTVELGPRHHGVYPSYIEARRAALAYVRNFPGVA